MKRNKTYEFSWQGYYEMQNDIKQAKIQRISKCTSLVLVGGLVAFGAISTPLAGILVTNMAIGTVLDFFL